MTKRKVGGSDKRKSGEGGNGKVIIEGRCRREVGVAATTISLTLRSVSDSLTSNAILAGQSNVHCGVILESERERKGEKGREIERERERQRERGRERGMEGEREEWREREEGREREEWREREEKKERKGGRKRWGGKEVYMRYDGSEEDIEGHLLRLAGKMKIKCNV
jgi:hypothetical protein